MPETFHTVELIPIERIRANDYNPNAMSPAIYGQLVENIKTRGFKSAIYVLPANGDGIYEIVDGEHRWRAAKEAGQKELPCVVLPATEAQAKMDCITMNQLRGDLVPVRLALVIADLAKTHPVEELERQLGFEEHELTDQLELLKLPDGIGRTIELQAEMEEREALRVLTFVVHQPQAEVIEKVIKRIEEQLGGKNPRGCALEQLATEFLASHPDAASVERTGEVADGTGG